MQRQVLILAMAIIVPSLICVLILASPCRATDSPAEVRKSFIAEQYTRKTIYHSPQTPGYTCWVGGWIMQDKSLMVTFKQATGPVEGRPRSAVISVDDPGRDFTGLNLANIYLRSADGGLTWDKVSEEAFPGPIDRPTWGGSHIALSDGAIIRAVDGSQLPLVPDLPRRIYFQRSRNLGKTWGQPEIPPEPRRPMQFLGDYGDCISRVRRLRDGSLIATGVIRPDPSNRRLGEPLLMLSEDEGKTWNPQHIILTAEHHKPGVWDEWDSAELSDGRLLCVFRRSDPQKPSKQVRWQGILRRRDNVWALENYQPSVLEHSGHPELLVTREGVVLHIATTGIHWTDDAGATWHLLKFRGLDKPYRSRYYPRSVQTEDGRIYVFSHLGWDNAYGKLDQSIVMDTFRLAEN